MQPPIAGDWPVEIRAARQFAIHGDLYYELHVVKTDDPSGEQTALRVPQHALNGPVGPGDRLVLSFLMGQVTAARRVHG
ncbi:MAG TPA: hypothetical protein VFB66_31520 [Tepidisphaeraceae bacterium]|jgi:hypothetical protein|nr:hypothetical protein [Tepidisphaeraceae bacterium]